MSDSYGRNDLLEYLMRHPEGMKQSDAIMFLKHPDKGNRYRAISQLQDKQKIIRRHIHGEPWLFPGLSLGSVVPDLNSERYPLRTPTLIRNLFIALVKYNSQHRNQPGAQRFNAVVSSLVNARRGEVELLSLMIRMMDNDTTQADWDFVLGQLIAKGADTLDPNKDIRESWPYVRGLLIELGAIGLGYTEDELDTIEDFNDRSVLESRSPGQERT